MEEQEARFKRILNKQTMTPEEQGFLIRYINEPEKKNQYHLTTEVSDDRIGKYRILTLRPRTEDRERIKIYMIPKNGPDLTSFKLQYYDILRSEKSNSFKAVRLSMLAKNLELSFSRELKIHDRNPKEFDDVAELLEKVKKAWGYYSYKMFLDSRITTDENGSAEVKTSETKADDALES